MEARLKDLIKEIEIEIENLKDSLENSRQNFYSASRISKEIFTKEEIVRGFKKQIELENEQ